jgi:hypothetical protein
MSPHKEIRFIILEKRFDNETTMLPDQRMASSENGKTAANQRDHSHHCIPSTAQAVTPPKVGVISVTLRTHPWTHYLPTGLDNLPAATAHTNTRL